MPHDDQYTAVGPPLAGSGFPFAAFSTKTIKMEYGINVQGKQCGVYGEGFTNPSNDRFTPVPGIGVCGRGENFGVFGDGFQGIVGVVGQHNRKNRAGVVGAVKLGGLGVVGTSNASINPTIYDSFIDPANGLGTGIYGESEKGIGVYGISQERTGRGGVFKSSKGAQVRLTPNDLGALPKDGCPGDLLVTFDFNDSKNREKSFKLWFCIKEEDESTAAQWAPVSLGTPTYGTI
ncbi:hypothetical protein P9Z39_22870 [Bacillus thuringiensis]|uniref:hypothetical protein n=1 Tax=Bacillus thuringiensis TaxID=1428 RepID=UPI00080F04D1|nr:hypothetical protein [Bacillus thuringiensis]ANT39960.1 hypothetical protein BMBtpLA1_30 [Bacillus phage vB_BtS_BMBtp13]MEC2708496.1 hypothetical protein [Bacillus thuringiensis]OUB68479.1 hypothetical protein BK765_19710 [Bacillus thuringiensis serovar dakota]